MSQEMGFDAFIIVRRYKGMAYRVRGEPRVSGKGRVVLSSVQDHSHGPQDLVPLEVYYRSVLRGSGTALTIESRSLHINEVHIEAHFTYVPFH